MTSIKSNLSNWRTVYIEDVFAEQENGVKLSQGWSPQCLKTPAPENSWGVLKTTSIQAGYFLESENKQLPHTLQPRKHLEVKEGDILITCAGPRNRCGVACLVKRTRKKLIISGKMYRFRANENIAMPEFIEMFLQTQRAWFAIDKMKTGGSDSGLNLTHSRFKKLEIPLPPLPEQHAIVSKIEELFSELENGKQQLQTALQQLKVYRQSLLKAAFEGKLTNKNVKEGELPKGWIIKKLNEIGTWKGGGTPSKSKKEFWQNGSILWVSPKDMKSHKIYDTIDKITSDAIENSSTKLIPKGSILFVVRSGILRRTLPIALTVSDVTVNQDLQALTPKDVLPDYVYWYVSAKNDDIRKTCSKDGTTVESIESTLLKNYSIPICSYEEQQLIVQELESKLTVCDKIEEAITQSLQQAETLRQSILKQAFEGKLVPSENFIHETQPA